jgi:hypothetical protein
MSERETMKVGQVSGEIATIEVDPTDRAAVSEFLIHIATMLRQHAKFRIIICTSNK